MGGSAYYECSVYVLSAARDATDGAGGVGRDVVYAVKVDVRAYEDGGDVC